MRGLFLSLEGGEGSGKSTQLAFLARRVEEAGRSALTTREPGGTPMGVRTRELLVRRSDDPPTPMAELFLYAADRAHHVATVIRPALRAAKVILCDRYADATEAYQGWGRELPLEVVRAVNRMATGGLWPDRTVVLDLPPRVGVERALARQRRDGGPAEVRFEAEAIGFHERVRAGYLAIAEANPDRTRVVDAEGTPGSVAQAVWNAVEDLFRG
jgi:dTMP kinase